MREFIGGILATIQVHATSIAIAVCLGLWLAIAILMLEGWSR